MADGGGVELLQTNEAPVLKADITAVYNKMKATFATGRTKSYEWRVQQLRAIVAMVEENLDGIKAAISEDLGRPDFEIMLGECGVIVTEAKFAIANLSAWMKPQKEWTSMLTLPASSEVVKEPKGLCSTLPLGTTHFRPL